MLKKKLILILFCYALQFAAFSQAADSIRFEGSIEYETVDAFIDKHRNTAAKTLIVNSEGGVAEAGIIFANWILEKKLDVEVDGVCMSACANYLFLSGKTKTVKKKSLVLWHGGLEQKNFRDNQLKFEKTLEIVEKFGIQALGKTEATEFRYWEKVYLSVKRIRKMQADFLSRIGVDEYLFRLGQEPVMYFPACWSANRDVLTKLGVTDLDVPENFGSQSSFSNGPNATLLCQGRPQAFMLEKTGAIVAEPYTPAQPKRFFGQIK